MKMFAAFATFCLLGSLDQKYSAKYARHNTYKINVLRSSLKKLLLMASDLLQLLLKYWPEKKKNNKNSSHLNYYAIISRIAINLQISTSI